MTANYIKAPQDINRAIVIGELNVDLIASGLESTPVLGQETLAKDFQVTLGSASAIFACGLAKLAHQVTFVSQVGVDYFGKFCLDSLRQSGVSTELVAERVEMRTGVTISLSTTHDRALVTFLGAIAELKAEDLPPAPLFEGKDHLHLTSYFLQHGLRPAFPHIMREARRMGLTVSFDPNADPTAQWNDQNITEVLKQTDVLFLNETEARQLTGRADANEALITLGNSLPCVAIKLGARGAMAMRQGEIAFSAGFKLPAVDTTGAGDSFAAGFLHAFFQGSNLQTCLLYGNACGALSTLQAGGTTNQPTRSELNEFLQSHHDNQ